MGYFSFDRQRKQAIEGLIDTTYSCCLPFKICASKIHLKSLKILILCVFQTPPKLLVWTIFFEISY